MILRDGSYDYHLAGFFDVRVRLVGLVDTVRRVVRPRQLDIPRCSDPLRACKTPT